MVDFDLKEKNKYVVYIGFIAMGFFLFVEPDLNKWWFFGAGVAGLVYFHQFFDIPPRPREMPPVGPQEPFGPQQQWELGEDGKPRMAMNPPRRGR